MTVDPALPVSNVKLLNDLLDEDVAARRIGTIVLVAFAAFAVLLAVVGIYGVISFFVVQHIPEIGVRLALGAQTRDILMLVAGKGVDADPGRRRDWRGCRRRGDAARVQPSVRFHGLRSDRPRPREPAARYFWR